MWPDEDRPMTWLEEAKLRTKTANAHIARSNEDFACRESARVYVYENDAPRALALLERAMVLLRQYNYSTPLQFIDESNAWLRDLEGKEAPDA